MINNYMDGDEINISEPTNALNLSEKDQLVLYKKRHLELKIHLYKIHQLSCLMETDWDNLDSDTVTKNWHRISTLSLVNEVDHG